MKNYNRVEKDEYGIYYLLDYKFHRLDGPAIKYNDGEKEWYYEDNFIDCNSQEEFERYIKLKLFW